MARQAVQQQDPTVRSARHDDGGQPDPVPWVNTVVLRGRVSSDPEARVLPSGTEIVSFRVTVPRERTPMTSGSRATSDWVVCSAWSARQRRVVSTWRVGDTVEVEGALRRRVGRGGAAASRVDVEVLGGRRLARAAPATRPRVRDVAPSEGGGQG